MTNVIVYFTIHHTTLYDEERYFISFGDYSTMWDKSYIKTLLDAIEVAKRVYKRNGILRPHDVVTYDQGIAGVTFQNNWRQLHRKSLEAIQEIVGKPTYDDRQSWCYQHDLDKQSVYEFTLYDEETEEFTFT